MYPLCFLSLTKSLQIYFTRLENVVPFRFANISSWARYVLQLGLRNSSIKEEISVIQVLYIDLFGQLSVLLIKSCCAHVFIVFHLFVVKLNLNKFISL